MDYKELGLKLKTERERQGLTVSDIHDQLKIGPSSVEAIEAGDADRLPHIVYYKGFVKNYANFLGLDPAELLKPFEQRFSLDEEEPQEEIESPGKPVRVSRGKKWTITIASVILGLCLVVVLGWLYTKLFMTGPQQQIGQQPLASLDTQKETPQSREEPGEKRSESLASESGPLTGDISDQEMDTVQEENEPAQPPEKSLTDTDDTLGRGDPREEAESASPVEQESPEETTRVQDQQPEEQTEIFSQEGQAPDETTAAGHTLRISASEACWLSADMDDRSKDIYLRPGESITLRFARELALKLGNAGGVRLAYDGSPYELEAASGEVLTLKFP
ncbi:MAG: DUF4115 domain-containing protein [Desulfohalobiaceae bacterium]|nr:DUF4115 domain-containing protein [Desulfohalobiaceae bacterium]